MESRYGRKMRLRGRQAKGSEIGLRERVGVVGMREGFRCGKGIFRSREGGLPKVSEQRRCTHECVP
jgi:hypothetical protein